MVGSAVLCIGTWLAVDKNSFIHLTRYSTFNGGVSNPYLALKMYNNMYRNPRLDQKLFLKKITVCHDIFWPLILFAFIILLF